MDDLTLAEVSDENLRFAIGELARSSAGRGGGPRHGVRIGSPGLLDVENVRMFLGYVGSGEPVCTGALIETPDEVAGVYNIATVETHRRRGRGEAMTWQ